MSEGLLDTNVFVHAYTNDAHADECVRFLAGLESGRLRARLDPLVLHEQYILMVLDWEGVEGEKAVMADAVERWRDTPGLGFVDAYLAAAATARQSPVFTKNIRDLADQGATVPDPLPS
jgi:predicted nucleic acid-binding protein